MNKLFYPALFTPEKNGAFTVEFPDVSGCVTCGDNMEDAYKMAFDCLGVALSYMVDNNEEIPYPSSPQDMKFEKNQFIVVIEFDMTAYKKTVSSKAVKKTLSIPEWLNEAALEKNINFSQVLQDALIQKINVK